MLVFMQMTIIQYTSREIEAAANTMRLKNTISMKILMVTM